MYEIKINGNYNVIINDLKISLSRATNDSVVLDKETFESSNDIKKLLAAGVIVAEKTNEKSAKNSKTAEVVNEKVLTDGNTFVRDGNSVQNPDDVFVATPKGVGEQEEGTQQEVGVEETETTETTDVVTESEVKESTTENKATKKSTKNPGKKTGKK